VDISFLLGTNDRPEALDAALRSIRMLMMDTSLTMEIVVVAGPASDYIDKPDVTWIQTNYLDGAVDAFNKAFACSRGDFICTLNDDMTLEGDIEGALARFDDPQVGQVAFHLIDKDTSKMQQPQARVQTIHFKPYANFGLIRRSVAELCAWVSGGFWAPVYWTYGADTELSCWVWRLGFSVVSDINIVVTDLGVDDPLRANNHANGRADTDRRTFWSRWATGAQLEPGGPRPMTDDATVLRLQHVDSGRGSVAGIGLFNAVEEPAFDSPRGILPYVESADSTERALLLYITHPSEPQAALVDSFKSTYPQHAIVTCDHPPAHTDYNELIDVAEALKPTVFFAQAQWPEMLPVEVVRQLRATCPGMKIVTWSGDVAGMNSHTNFDWFVELGRVVDLTLHCSMTHVRVLKSKGVVAACMQCGYDDHLYFPSDDETSYGSMYDIAFIYSRYGRDLPLTLPEQTAWMREETMRALKQTYTRTRLGGGIKPVDVPHIYRASHMAASVSISGQLERYSSDRLYRVLGSGTLALVHYFDDMESHGLVNGTNCLVFHNPIEARDIALTALSWPNERRREIGLAGAQLASQHHTWRVRLAELNHKLRVLRGR
jgi:hypothetical protein